MSKMILPEGWELRNLGGVEGLKPACEFLDHLRVPINEKERAKRPGPYPYYGANGQQGWIDDFIFDDELVLLAEDGGFFLVKLGQHAIEFLASAGLIIMHMCYDLLVMSCQIGLIHAWLLLIILLLFLSQLGLN